MYESDIVLLYEMLLIYYSRRAGQPSKIDTSIRKRQAGLVGWAGGGVTLLGGGALLGEGRDVLNRCLWIWQRV